MFDYSYLNRISGDSRSLHIEVLELFCRVGEKNQRDILDGLEKRNQQLVAGSIKDMYPSLRIMGMCGFIEEAEDLETVLSDSKEPVEESVWTRVQAFCKELADALEYAAKEIVRYKQAE